MKSMTIRDEMCRIDGDDDDNNNYDDDAINRFILNNGTFICSENYGILCRYQDVGRKYKKDL